MSMALQGCVLVQIKVTALTLVLCSSWFAFSDSDPVQFLLSALHFIALLSYIRICVLVEKKSYLYDEIKNNSYPFRELNRFVL